MQIEETNICCLKWLPKKQKRPVRYEKFSHFFLESNLTSLEPIDSCLGTYLFCFKGSLTPLTTDIENEIDSSPCKSSTKVPIGENMFNYLILPE